MICIQCAGAAIFFPDSEISDAMAIENAGKPSIAFRSRGTGRLQYIKQFRSLEERDNTLQMILSADQQKEPDEKQELIDKLQERLRITEQELERMRRAQATPKASRAKTKKKQEETPIEPPTDEEIIAYIQEKGIDQKLGQPAETLAESFRDIYEREEEVKDKAGNITVRTVWRKANGSIVKDWKGCLRTFKGRQLMWAGETATQSNKTRGKRNQFNDFQQNDYDFDELEKELAETPTNMTAQR